MRQDFWQNFWQNPKCRRPRTYKFLQGIFSVSLKKDLFFKFIYIYIHTYIYIYIYIYYMLYISIYIYLVITPMALWQLINLGTWCTVLTVRKRETIIPFFAYCHCKETALTAVTAFEKGFTKCLGAAIIYVYIDRYI